MQQSNTKLNRLVGPDSPACREGSSSSKRGETMARRDSSNLDACRGIIYSGRSSQRPSQYELKRGNSTMKVTPRVDLPAGGSAEMEDSPAQQIVVDPYAEPQPGKLSTRSKSGRQSTLADMLWKRSNTNVDLLRRSSASKMHQKLKSRHSLPAGLQSPPPTLRARCHRFQTKPMAPQRRPNSKLLRAHQLAS